MMIVKTLGTGLVHSPVVWCARICVLFSIFALVTCVAVPTSVYTFEYTPYDTLYVSHNVGSCSSRTTFKGLVGAFHIRTHVGVRIIEKGMRGGLYASKAISRRRYHSIWFGDGAYASSAFLWDQICASGFPPHPGPVTSYYTEQGASSSGQHAPVRAHDTPPGTQTTSLQLPNNLQPHNGLMFPCQQWVNIQQLYTSWVHTTSNFIHKLTICASCGYTAFGSSTPMRTSCDNSAQCYLNSNPHVAQYCISNMMDDETLVVHVCDACHAKPGRWNSYVAGGHNTQYVSLIVGEKYLLNFQMLSIVDISLNFKESYIGHAKGNLAKESFLTGALIDWSHHPDKQPNQHTFRSVFQINLIMNPLVRNFKTVCESNEFNSLGISVLPPSSVTNIVQTHADNAPTLWADDDDNRPYNMSTIVPPTAVLCAQNPFLKKFNVGTSQKRFPTGDSLPNTETFHLVANANTMISTDNTTSSLMVSSVPPPSIEAALFPFLFPKGTGYFQGLTDFHQYLKQRMQCMFSLYTLYTPYVLIMFQLKQSLLLLNAVTVVSLDNDIRKFRACHPNSTESDALRNVAKYSIPKTIPNTPQYHRNHLQNLLAMVAAFGMPNYFLTLTADEISELRWPEYTGIETVLGDLFDNDDLNWKDAPVECTRLFKTRVDHFFKEHICPKNKSGILGKVNHYLIRYEFQDRGSPHVHVILWIDSQDEDRVSNEIIAYIPAYYDAETNSFIPPTDPMKKRLFDIVMRKQMHTCSPFGKGCRKHGKCSKAFPYMPNENGTIFDNASNRWQYARPFVGRPGVDSLNRNVVPYHPIVTTLWNAHSNLLRITAEAWSFYVLKYATKMEPTGFLNLDIQTAKRLMFSAEITDAQLKLISGMVLTKPIAPTEAAHNILQYPIIHFSDTCHFISSAPPSMRSRAQLRPSTVCVPHVDTYCARPAHMEAESFKSFFKKFIIRGVALPSKQLQGMTNLNQYIYKAPPNYVVRFTQFHPCHQTEAFAYNLLLNDIPFMHENELISRENQEETYLRELSLRGIITSEECIERLADAYSDYNLYTNEARQALYEALSVDREKWHLNTLDSDDTSDDNHTQIPTVDLRDNINNLFEEMGSHLLTSHDNPHDRHEVSSPLTPSQQEVYDNLIRPGQSGVHIILGSPGAGKTYMTKVLIDTYKSQNKKLVLCSSTGIAATRLHACATTVHNAFVIPPNGFLAPFSPSHPKYAALRDADVIIIDECSMMTAKTMLHVMYRIAQVENSQDPEVYMKRKLVILVGDLCQLPPVCKHQVSENDVCVACHITSYPHWSKAVKHHLHTSYRHANDSIFSQFLNQIRMDRATQAAIDAVLSDCYIHQDKVIEYIHKDTTILCTHIDRTDYYNGLAMKKLFPSTSVIKVSARVSKVPLDLNTEDTAWYETWLSNTHFHRLPFLAIGAKVMLTTNMTTLEQGANGDFAYVMSWKLDPNGDVKSIQVFVPRSNKLKQIGRSLSQSISHRCGHFRKCTFPLALAYAITGHKSQGGTLSDTTIIHMDGAFAPGLAYVMLSRVTERRHLKIVGFMKASDIIPMPRYITDLFE